MAATKKSKAAAAARAAGAKPASEVSRAEFDALNKSVGETNGAVNRILDLLEKAPPAGLTPSPVEPADIASVSVAASAKAAPNKVQTNPEWEGVAKEILGEALDHTEVEHERAGGIKFTVVIKSTFSNADKSYLELMKTDRRTKEVSQEGIAGVEEWCRQIKANLTRTQKITARQ